MTVVPNLSFIFGTNYVLPNHIVKQPDEVKLLSFECSGALSDGDAISTFVVTVRTEDGSAIVPGMVSTIVINDSIVTMWLSNGTNGLVYAMEMMLTSVVGEIIENEIRIIVREKGY